MIKKILYIGLGFISLFLGILGIIVPGLPTTPFLLLTAWFFVRSSDRLYNWLIEHKIFGAYIKNLQKGMSVKYKIISLLIMWTMIFVSSNFLINDLTVIKVVIGLGFIGSFVILYLRQPDGRRFLMKNKSKN